MGAKGVCRCDACLCWKPPATIGELGECRREAPRMGKELRGYWPRTLAEEGCHVGVPIPRTSRGPRADVIEVTWRVEDVWEAHLAARAGWFRDQGITPEAPALTQQIRGAILKALHEHDGSLLGSHQREKWQAHSRARAAGIGLFLSGYHCGENDQGKRYLEATRPWVRLAGKPDPVTKFADLYFRWRAGDRKA